MLTVTGETLSAESRKHGPNKLKRVCFYSILYMISLLQSLISFASISENDNGLSGGAIAAIVIGIFLIIAGGIAYIIYKYRRVKKE